MLAGQQQPPDLYNLSCSQRAHSAATNAKLERFFTYSHGGAIIRLHGARIGYSALFGISHWVFLKFNHKSS